LIEKSKGGHRPILPAVNTLLDLDGSEWTYMDLDGPTWTYMDLDGPTLSYLFPEISVLTV